MGEGLKKGESLSSGKSRHVTRELKNLCRCYYTVMKCLKNTKNSQQCYIFEKEICFYGIF